MPEVPINGIFVKFPFVPYDVQKEYMSKVIECLQTGNNGILESPTGTGKTLCLLCSTLAWLEVRKAHAQAISASQTLLQDNCQTKLGDTKFKTGLIDGLSNAAGTGWVNSPNIVMPKIIYSSRTHSQLSQVVQELKRSEYRHVRATVLGSRDQLCLHPEVMKETNSSTKIHMCRAKVTARTCPFYNNVEASLSSPSLRQTPVVDIEDLNKIGNKNRCCPYYLSRSLKQEADITFMPYNYLLDSKARKSHSIELEGNVIIFDEAHNVEKMCEDNASVEIRSQDIASCISDVTQAMQQVTNMQQHTGNVDGGSLDNFEQMPNVDFSLNDLCILKTLMCELEEQLEKIPLGSDSSATFPGAYIFEFLEKVEIRVDRKAVILEMLDKVIQFLSEGSSSVLMRRGNGLQKFADTLRVIFYRDSMNRAYLNVASTCYKVHVCCEDPKKQRNDVWNLKNSLKSTRTLSYWCFNPGIWYAFTAQPMSIAMQGLLEHKARCIILTSGTLAPLETFAAELRISLPVRLENPHIIGKNQVWIGVVPKGPDGVELNSSFNNRSNPKYVMSLGHTIVNFARAIPHGLLVFFPSYTIMNECQKAWEAQHIWQALARCKTIFVENKLRNDFQQVMDEYYKENTAPGKGGVFLAVCRGKVSEGLDFADQNGRAVIITGLPFPPWKDPKVTLKMAYQNDQLKEKKQGLNGNDWYRLEALRAVNQAIGRVIRHKDDYGAIILCDSRFGAKNLQSQLSAWLRPHIQSLPNYGKAIVGVTQFFKDISIQGSGDASRNKTGPEICKLATNSVGTPLNKLEFPLASTSSPRSRCIVDDSKSFTKTDWTSQRLLYGYSPSVPSVSPSSSQSLIDALDCCEDKFKSSNFLSVKKHSLNVFEDLNHIASKKKKITVLGPGKQVSVRNLQDSSKNCKDQEVIPALQPIALDEVSSKCSISAVKLNSEVPETAKAKYANMILKMKKFCSAEAYGKFKTVMKAYAETKDSEKLGEGFLSICVNKEILDCLKGFRNFLPENQRQWYDNNLLKSGV